MFAAAAQRFPVNPPQTKEAYLYRHLFEQFFPGEACARDGAGRQVDRVLVAGGDRLGRGVRERSRSVGARGRGGAPGGAGDGSVLPRSRGFLCPGWARAILLAATLSLPQGREEPQRRISR